MTVSSSLSTLAPEGIPVETISASNHPSNVAVFNAASLHDAVDQTMNAFCSGRFRAAVWLRRPISPESYSTWQHYERTLDAHRSSTLGGLREILSEARLLCSRVQKSSSFYPHIDICKNSIDTLDERDGPLPMTIARHLPFQINDILYGPGSLLFQRSYADYTRDLLKNSGSIDIANLGTAYMIPTGSMAFLTLRCWGIEKAILHSAPQTGTEAIEGQPDTRPITRRIDIYNCSGYRP